MTAPRCPAKRFRTARYARRYAWSLEADPQRRPVPVECPACTAWHLVAPESIPTTTNGARP